MITRLTIFVLTALLVAIPVSAGDDTIVTIAGIPPGTVILVAPHGVAIHSDGSIYIADADQHRIVKYESAVGFTVIAGTTGTKGSSGDGGAATSALMETPLGVAVDSNGHLFIADTENHTIRRVDAATGIITRYAGNGAGGYGGDGGAATSAMLKKPAGLAFDGSDNLHIADMDNHVVRKIDSATGIITTVAGNGSGGYDGDGVQATSTRLKKPHHVAVDGFGDILIADADNHRVRKVDVSTGDISTFAGEGSDGITGDGGDATLAKVGSPFSLFVDSSDNVYIASNSKHAIRRVDGATGVITTVAGTGSGGNEGDDGPATLAKLKEPSGVVLDSSGVMYISDSGNDTLRKVETDGIITALAGDGAYFGDGGLATLARMSEPIGVTADSAKNVYVAEKKNCVIRKIDYSTGIISTVAGTGSSGYSGDGGAATSAQLKDPYDVAVDSSGNIFIAGKGSHVIRRVDGATGIITTFAGTGSSGYEGDGGQATMAKLGDPYGVAVDTSGNVYIADVNKHVVRKVDVATGIITTVIGTGSAGDDGDGGLATLARIEEPYGIDVDSAGNIYIADKKKHRIRMVTAATGIITTVAGTGSGGYSGDGGLATLAQIEEPYDVAVDSRGNIYIAGKKKHVIRKVEAGTGIISTVVGTAGSSGYSGDGGLATAALINEPWGIGVNRRGGLYIAGPKNHVVRFCDYESSLRIISWQEVDPNN